MAAGYPGRYYAYVLLGLAGPVALMPAVYGIARRTWLCRGRLGAIGGGLALISAALSLADWGGELVKVEMGALSTTFHDAIVALLGRFDSSARIAAPLQISGIAFLLGMILLAIGLFRGRTAPGWVCVTLVAGALGNLAGFATGFLLVLDLGNVALVVGMGYLAIRPPMLQNALTNRRGNCVLSSTARVGTNGAATSVS